MGWCVPDFETRSRCDLKAAGAWRYAEDPTTEIITLHWEDQDGKRGLWHPGEPLPQVLLDAIASGGLFVAHNAAFEQAIWKHQMVAKHGAPPIPIAQWHCTMARCAELALPQKLERVLPVLNLPMTKDTAGSKLTIGLSKPDKVTGLLPEITPAILTRVDTYCASDIYGQVALHRRLGWQGPEERAVWLCNERINQRGIGLDLDFVRGAQSVVDKATGPLAAEFKQLTGGLNFTQGAKVIGWAHERGVHLDNMQKEYIGKLLGEDEEDGPSGLEDVMADVSLPPDVRRALHIRHLIGSASVKKLATMEQCVCSDGRVRGTVAYHAATTGRFAGRLIQPHNFPRGTDELIKTPVDQKVSAILTGDPEWVELLFGPPVECVVSSLRHALIANPDRRYVSGDFAQIEARMVLAVAGQADKVELFKQGLDPYCDMATSIYGEPVTKADTKRRQIGKNSVLGLGFNMGAAKFHMKYAPDQPMSFCQRVVDTYRNDWAPCVPELWQALGDAALACMEDGVPTEAYGMVLERIDRWLTMLLPSGRRLWYDDPRLVWREMPWSTDEKPDIRRSWTYMAMKQGHRQTINAFGGLLAENAAQALARDLLVRAMLTCEKNGFPVVLTVHDEIVAEPMACDADETALKQIMEDVPDWAKAIGVPVKCETWSGDRYRK